MHSGAGNKPHHTHTQINSTICVVLGMLIFIVPLTGSPFLFSLEVLRAWIVSSLFIWTVSLARLWTRPHIIPQVKTQSPSTAFLLPQGSCPESKYLYFTLSRYNTSNKINLIDKYIFFLQVKFQRTPLPLQYRGKTGIRELLISRNKP